jgi:hypothetical protein
MTSAAAAPIDLAALVRSRLGIDLRELAGAAVAGEIPLTDGVLNRLIAERIGDHPHVRSVRVETHDADWAAIHVVARSRLVPSLRFTARIEQQPALPDDPTLRLQWSMPSAGPLALLAGPMLSYFNKLPPGITMTGDRVVIDVRHLLRMRGLDGALPFVKRLAVHTRAGAFVVRFELGV